MSNAPKYDGGKLPMHLIPPAFLRAIAAVLAFGAKKYAAWSWTKGKEWSKDYSAIQRHLSDWYDGIDTDIESGLPHLAHAACDLMFLYVAQLCGFGIDDRPTAVRPPKPVIAPPAFDLPELPIGEPDLLIPSYAAGDSTHPCVEETSAERQFFGGGGSRK
jgi:hypothetical protein